MTEMLQYFGISVNFAFPNTCNQHADIRRLPLRTIRTGQVEQLDMKKKIVKNSDAETNDNKERAVSADDLIEALGPFTKFSDDPNEYDLHVPADEDYIDDGFEEYDGLEGYDDEFAAEEGMSDNNQTISMKFPHVERVAVSTEFPPDDEIIRKRYPVVRVNYACPFPSIPMSIPQSFDENQPIVEQAMRTGDPIVILYQDTEKYDRLTSKGLSRTGVLAKIVRCVSDEHDPTMSVMLTVGGPRVQISRFYSSKGLCEAFVQPKKWRIPDGFREIDMAAYIHEIIDKFDVVHELEQSAGPKASDILGTMDEMQFISTLLFALSVNPKVKNEILEMPFITQVCDAMLMHLGNLIQLLELRRDINNKVNKELDESQRENFIQHQIDLLQKEIGQGAVSDWDTLSKRASEKIWSDATKEHFERELAKLKRFNQNTPDYSIQYSYLDTFLTLPWKKSAPIDTSLDKISRTLNEDHFGLERVKERILEHMAVAQLRGDNKSPIICLVGPPGVGKTSLGKSIASAMGREYGRVAFGGLHDEAEIRGHRRTYIGAMPGRIIAALLKTEFSNPVIVLDEIDKIGKDYKGDPSTALLEVLDPEQNSKFHDNYLDADYDLSEILFIATANSLETVSGPLRDRMEIISIPGYITAEKIEIAKRHLLPKQLEANGMSDEPITFTDEALIYIIDYYTRESGVRKLEKTIGKVLRKLAVRRVRGQEFPREITREVVSELLGKEEFSPEMYENNDSIGVVTGLAWTQVGGEILFIESSITEGKGKLTLTGNLGDVMKESATLALQYLKSHAESIGVTQKEFDSHDVHIHVPEGAIPKDGPSAGITMATSLASSFSGRKVRPKLAMTGEITLRGKVLPVGGIREKIIAAKRAGIEEIILSRQNKKDILEVKAEYLEGLTFTYVDNVAEVLERALV